jgi:hypothetical protein
VVFFGVRLFEVIVRVVDIGEIEHHS